MVYALQKFRNYLLGGHFKMITDHSALNYLVNKPMLGGRMCRWLLLFQEFDFEIIVKSCCLNVCPNHLSRIEIGGEPTNIDEGLSDAQLFRVNVTDNYYDQIIKFLATRVAPKYFSTSQKKKLVIKASNF